MWCPPEIRLVVDLDTHVVKMVPAHLPEALADPNADQPNISPAPIQDPSFRDRGTSPGVSSLMAEGQ